MRATVRAGRRIRRLGSRTGNRPSGDVDLFTSWQHHGEFPELKAAVIAALEAAGYKATVIMSAETFTRLTLADPADGAEEKVELSVDWRAHQADAPPRLPRRC